MLFNEYFAIEINQKHPFNYKGEIDIIVEE